MLQRCSVGFLCCRVPELCGYGRAVRPFGAVCACALGAAVQEAEPVLPSAHNIDLVTSTRYFTANALIYLCSAHLCGDCSSICSWTRVTAGAHDPHKHQQTLPLSVFARCISSLLVEMSQEYEYDLVTIGAGAVLHWLHMMTECCAAAIMTGCTRSGLRVLNAAPVKHLGYFKISACLYRAPAHDPTCIYPPATISPPTTATAGSGGVRASRFAAQYYNAKVAVVELPFDFVSSDDKGGAYTHVRHPHCSFVWHCLHMPSKAGCAGRCVPAPSPATGAGGTCVIRGCVPKKLLVYGAAFNEEFADATGFGWAPVAPPHDWKSACVYLCVWMCALSPHVELNTRTHALSLPSCCRSCCCCCCCRRRCSCSGSVDMQPPACARPRRSPRIQQGKGDHPPQRCVCELAQKRGRHLCGGPWQPGGCTHRQGMCVSALVYVDHMCLRV